MRPIILLAICFVPQLLRAQPQAEGAIVPAVSPTLMRTVYDMGALSRATHLTELERDGRRLFVQYCGLCHDSTGQPTHDTYGPTMTVDLVRALGDDHIASVIANGSERMPGFRYQLKTKEIQCIVDFLASGALSGTSISSSPVPHTDPLVPPSSDSAPVRGVIRENGNSPLGGVAVSARADDRTVTVTVFSDESGRFYLPPLAAGHYVLIAQAVGYEAAKVEVTIGRTIVNLAPIKVRKLDRAEEIYPQLSSSEWLDSLPQKTRDDRRMREIFRLNCMECHGANVALERRFDEHGWAAIIRFMEQGDYGGWMGRGDTRQGDTENVGFGPSIRYHADELARYLARVRGPDSPTMPIKLLPLPSGLSAKVVITAYDIPPSETPQELAWWDGTEWSKGAASGMHGAGGMHDVVVDRQGNAWLTESLFNDARTITKVDAESGQVTGFGLPPTPGSPWKADISHGIAVDTQGIVWFGELGKLGRIDPASGSFQTFQIPTPESLQSVWNETWTAVGGPAPMQASGYLLGTIDEDATHQIWGSAFLGVWRFDPQSHRFAYYHDLSLPAQDPPPKERFNILFTYGVAGDAIGNGWWTTPNDERVVTVDSKSQLVREIVMRPPWYAEEESISTPEDRNFVQRLGKLYWTGIRPGAQYPRRLGADKEGNTVWVPNWWGRNIAKIDIRTHAVTYYKVPLNAHPYFIQVHEHKVWMNFTADDRVGVFDPATEDWTFYRLPINGCESRQITVDPLRGDVWVPCYRASKVYRLQLNSSQPR